MSSKGGAERCGVLVNIHQGDVKDHATCEHLVIQRESSDFAAPFRIENVLFRLALQPDQVIRSLHHWPPQAGSG
ncbi:MAG TPA: hypothetical protein ACQGQI_02590 [Xylella sp.]